ncbi:DUF1080 domain-containing protein [Fodinibius sp.]|uniref:3-keto-disaccharide hydrolase n=1 Tax=Fodinibius sp. TaxID=1872440 RepID=UPI00356776E9
MKHFFLTVFGTLFILTSPLHAQFPEPPEDEDAGFEQILTRETFDNWEGDRDYWRFEDGKLIGEVTQGNLLDVNTFFIWKEKVDDFELKVEYRVSAEGNSGINYRSEKVDGIPHALKGYQADADGPNQWSGQLYEERGREFLALRGQITHVGEDDKPREIGSVGEEEELAAVVNDGWNEYHLIVRGKTLIHMLNGQVMSVAIDDGNSRAMEGWLGVQIHQGPPMKVEFRNFRFREF